MTNLEKAKKKLELARAGYAQLLKVREDQLAAQENLKIELEQMEIGRGDRVLDAIMVDNAEKVAWAEGQAVLGKKIQLETVKDVLDALNPRIETARSKVIECKINCFRAEADGLDEQANKRQPKTDELLEQLREWEGCTYAPAYVIKVVEASRFGGNGSIPVPGQSITMELRGKALYYRECAEKILKNEGYSIDIMGDGSTFFPIPEYLGAYSECQPNK